MSLAHLLDPGPVHAITWALHLRRFEKIKRSPVSKVKFWFTISLVWEIVRIPNVFNIPASVIHYNHQKGAKRVLLKSQIPRGTPGSKISTPLFADHFTQRSPKKGISSGGVQKYDTSKSKGIPENLWICPYVIHDYDCPNTISKSWENLYRNWKIIWEIYIWKSYWKPWFSSSISLP